MILNIEYLIIKYLYNIDTHNLKIRDCIILIISKSRHGIYEYMLILQIFIL